MFLIKVTYETGPHAGKSYLLRKGGYVTDGTFENEDTTYRTYGSAARVCTRLRLKNYREYHLERENSHGKGPFVYEKEKYEPISL